MQKFLNIEFQGPDEINGGQVRYFVRGVVGEFVRVTDEDGTERDAFVNGSEDIPTYSLIFPIGFDADKIPAELAAEANYRSSRLGVPLRPDWKI
jgi:hypothetical protein